MNPIDEIKERLDIVEIISESVALRKSGRSYVGFCPFHSNTRTPAFTVYPDTQSFYCFGCSAAGTVFDFVMRTQGLDFRDALQQLAARAGVQLAPRSQEEQQQDQQRTRLLEINSAAAFYFSYVLLKHSRGQPGRDYIARRAIGPEAVEMFQLGYSLEEWDHLLHYLTDKKGFAADEVAAAGLAIQHEQRGFYDRFRGRLIFPIRNSKGELVGFGGRALGDAQPKYLNTPQTLLFDKSQILYGLDLARDAIRSTDAAVVVEGYVDVITAHQHGFRNVVAPLGTALNAGHVALLKKLSQHVYLALDADAAGQRATLRGLHAFEETHDPDELRPVATAQGIVRWERDIHLRIIKLPPGRDPDEVIRSNPQQWQALVEQALPVMDFYIEAYTADLDLSQPEAQSTALERLLPLVRQLSETRQRAYITRLEQVVGIRAEVLNDLVRKVPEQPHSGRKPQRPGDEPQPPRDPSRPTPDAPRGQRPALPRREDYLLLLLRHPSALPYVEALLKAGLQDFPQAWRLLGESIDRLLHETANRLLYLAWREAGSPALAVEALAEQPPVWAQALDDLLYRQLEHLAALPLPTHQTYLYIQDAQNSARHLRKEQVVRWQRRLSQQAHEGEDATEREQALTLLDDVQRYLSFINAPRRNRSWEDVRDSLGIPYD